VSPRPPAEPADDDPDAEALRWAGDEDRGRDTPRLGGSAHEPEPSDADPDDEPVDAPRRSSPGGAATAIFAVVYLALTIGWVLAVQRTSSGTTVFATELLWQFGEFLAIVAAPLWFGATVTLAREARSLVRIGWFALGAGVLIPWPLVLGVLAALST
jgi:hypothetical protein